MSEESIPDSLESRSGNVFDQMDSEVAQLRNAFDQITTAFNAQPSASTT